MYAIGDYVVHPGQGVCQVEGLTTAPNAVYLLLPVGQRHAMHISFPTEFEGRLRPVLSRAEAEKIVEGYDELEPMSFSARNIALEEDHYKGVIRSGTCCDSVRIVKTFRMRIADLIARGKKPPVAYDRIVKLAQERSSRELAVALGMAADDVVARLWPPVEKPVEL